MQESDVNPKSDKITVNKDTNYLITSRQNRTGFTLLEVLIVVGVIALLVSMITVVGGHIRALAENKSTRQTLIALKTGIEQFKMTFGYYPPLLSDDSESASDYLTILEDDEDRQDQAYYSTLTLVPYMIGIGDINQNGTPDIDGDGDDEFDDGYAGEGFRDPGPDETWGGAVAAVNRESYWQRYQDAGLLKGSVYKRLIELNESVKPAVNDAGTSQLDSFLFQIYDNWDVPIRYYKGWYGKQDDTDLEDGLPLDWPKEWFGANLPDERDNLVTALRSAPYVLMSAGRDRLATSSVNTNRNDDAEPEHDEDNIVEIAE